MYVYMLVSVTNRSGPPTCAELDACNYNTSGACVFAEPGLSCDGSCSEAAATLINFSGGSDIVESRFTIYACNGTVLLYQSGAELLTCLELPMNYSVQLLDVYGDGWSGTTSLSIGDSTYALSEGSESWEFIGPEDCGVPQDSSNGTSGTVAGCSSDVNAVNYHPQPDEEEECLYATSFTVDMNCSGVEFTRVYISGPWCNWCSCEDYNFLTEMTTEDDGGLLHTLTLDLPMDTGLVEYKYMVDCWSQQEDLVHISHKPKKK